MDELSQLDELIESDILEALGQDLSTNVQKEEPIVSEEEITLEDIDELELDSTIVDEEINIEPLEEQSNSINVDKDTPIQKLDSNINTNDLASLLSQLLTNKTIEITIKIKD